MMIGVAVDTSFVCTKTCDNMSGMVRQKPTPTPRTIWNPIHRPALDTSSSSMNKPDPTAAIAGPRIKNGLWMPVAVIRPPITICVIVKLNMTGTRRTPDEIAETPRTAWKYMGR